jgi:nucleoside-diphosphate-sugar epimerase
MTRVLVTGGAGFVGRNLTRRLLDKSWDVLVVDSLANNTGCISPEKGWPTYVPKDYENFSFINQDCRNYFKENTREEFDYVFHLAAVVGGRLTIENNPLAVATDLAIDSDMWSWAVHGHVGKVVNFSSSAAYPVSLQGLSDEVSLLKENMVSFESTIGMPDLTYGWAKLTSEYLGKTAWEKYGLKNIAYRPFSGYGLDQDLSYPFPSICKRALENIGSETFKVWGSGEQSRDFINIEDCITGILTTMDEIDDGDALNLSTGKPTSFFQFAKIATTALGYNPEIVGDLGMPAGVSTRVGDTEKQIKMGFRAQIDFETGIKEALAYFSKSGVFRT